MIKEIGFVAYPVKDMARARAFYEGILGLVPSDEYGKEDKGEVAWIEYNIGSSTLGLGCMDGWNPSPDGPSAALEMDNLKEFVEKLKEHKVEIRIPYSEFPPCHMAIIADSEGNSVILHQRKQSLTS